MSRRVEPAYGKTGLPLDLPDQADVLMSRQAPGLPDEGDAIVDALRHPIDSEPLKDRVKSGDTVAIVHTDITRATPNALILPLLLGELESAGIRREDITDFGEQRCAGGESNAWDRSDVLRDLLHQFGEGGFQFILLGFKQFDLSQETAHFELCSVCQKTDTNGLASLRLERSSLLEPK